jgi:hypothetical protein
MTDVEWIERHLNCITVETRDAEALLSVIGDTPVQKQSLEATIDASATVLSVRSIGYRLAVAFRAHALTSVVRHLLSARELPTAEKAVMVRITTPMVVAACRCR